MLLVHETDSDEVKDCNQRRLCQQADTRGTSIELRSLLVEDDISRLDEAHEVLDRLTISSDKQDLVVAELHDLCTHHNLDMAAIDLRESDLRSEVQKVITDAQEWIAAVTSIRLRQEERKLTYAGATPSKAPSTPLKTRNFEEIVKIQQSEIAQRDDLLKKMELRIKLLERSQSDTDSQNHLISQLKDTINKQYCDHDKEKARFQETIARLQDDSHSRTTQPVSGGRRSGSFGEFDRSSIHHDDLLALSQVMQRTNIDMVKSLLDVNLESQNKFLTNINTPKVELKTFDGDVTMFQSFLNRFDDIVGNGSASYSVKLNTLLQSCGPSVVRHLSSCEYETSREGYEEARRILKKLYGRPHLIVNAWVEKIMSHGKIASAASMQAFVCDLKSCYKTLDNMGYLSEIDNTEKKKILLTKVPTYLQNRWRKLVRKANDQDRNASLSDFIDIVQEATDEISDPVYGADSLAKVVNVYDFKSKPTMKKKSYMVTADEESIESRAMSPAAVAQNPKFKNKPGDGTKVSVREPCACCGLPHYTRRCDGFKKLSSCDKLALAREKCLCLLCLSPLHVVDDCVFTWRCQVVPCDGKHNNVFHDALKQEEGSFKDGALVSRMMTPALEEDADESTSEEDEDEPVSTLPSMMLETQMNDYAMPCSPVYLSTVGGAEFPTYAMHDTGGGFTVITKRMVDSAKIPILRRAKFDLGTISGSESVELDVVTFMIRGKHRSKTHFVFNAVVMDREIVSPRYAEAIKKMDKWPHLRELCLTSHDNPQVDVLIGQDNAHIMKREKTVSGPFPYAPYAEKTPVGWTVHGFNISRTMSRLQSCNRITLSLHGESSEAKIRSQFQSSQDQELLAALDRFQKLEEVPEARLISPENEAIEKMWSEKTTLENKHVTVPIPFKEEKLQLPNNFEGVLKRHESLGRRLVKDESLKKMFNKATDDMFDAGFAENVIEDAEPGSEWYIPTQAVLSDKKPGKCRVVGDGGYVFKGACLNDEVFAGPNYTANVVDILVKFRRFRIVITGDIKDMYSQVRVPESQRDCLRFLYWVDGDPSKEVTKHRMTTQMFGGKWSASASIYAFRWIAKHLEDEYHRETIETILRHFYVDDMLRSLIDEELGILVLTEARSLLSRASFRLTKIGSNSLKVLNSVPVEDRAKSYEEVGLELDGQIKDTTLGCVWRPGSDLLSFVAIKKTVTYTRRGVLSIMSSLYDPLGLVSPFILLARILLQDICKRGYDWDDIIAPDLAEIWDQWILGLQIIIDFKIPRWLGLGDIDGEVRRLHVFVDASFAGYGCAVYLTVRDVTGSMRSSTLLLAKAKVAPKKVLTIPRLELSAAVVGVKHEKMAREYLSTELESSVFWSDSTIVLHYVSGQPWNFKTFVANRVVYIQEHTGLEQWRHVSSEENVADVVSRGLTGEQLFREDRWLSGPPFLADMESWPRPFHEEGEHAQTDEMEMKCIAHMKFQILRAANVDNRVVCERLLGQYSRWNKLLRAIASWIRVKNYLRDGKSIADLGEFDVDEILRAELAVLRMTQDLFISDAQQKNRVFEKLYPFEDDGLWHVGGRLMYSSLSYKERHPIIFPMSPVLDAYIFHVHERVGHGGIDRTFFEARKKYWILGGKRAVKKVVNRCVTCRKNRGKFQRQIMAPLPSFRVEEGTVPFERVGVDYFGPFYVKQGRALVKRYCCMYSDLLMRACHIEVAPDLTASSFINSLQRFISVRGKPSLLVSDNGTNFVGGNKELKNAVKEWNIRRIDRFMAEKEIAWRFNTPAASHHGGAWERMIRSFRALAMTVIKNQPLTEDSLRTYVSVISQIMNSRPLTKISENVDDPRPLNPEHFLNLRRAQGLPGDYDRGDQVRLRWRQIQYLADKFWRRWVAEYLRALQMRPKWTDEVGNLKVGDVVLVLDEHMPRLKWPMGLVTETVVGRDGFVRSVKLKTKTGVMTRPITKVVNLECA